MPGCCRCRIPAASLQIRPGTGGSGCTRTPALASWALPVTMTAALAPKRAAGPELPQPPSRASSRKEDASHPSEGPASRPPVGSVGCRKRHRRQTRHRRAALGEEGRSRPEGRGSRWPYNDARGMTPALSYGRWTPRLYPAAACCLHPSHRLRHASSNQEAAYTGVEVTALPESRPGSQSALAPR